MQPTKQLWSWHCSRRGWGIYFAVCSEMLVSVCAILTDTLVRIQLVAYRKKKGMQYIVTHIFHKLKQHRHS